jgi:hypothetical protein
MHDSNPEMWFIFNLHRETPFLSSTHNITNDLQEFIIYKKSVFPYLEMQSLVHGGESPSSLVPCLKSTAFMPLALPSPWHPLHANRTFIYIYLHSPVDIGCYLHTLEFFPSNNEAVSSILLEGAAALSM